MASKVSLFSTSISYNPCCSIITLKYNYMCICLSSQKVSWGQEPQEPHTFYLPMPPQCLALDSQSLISKEFFKKTRNCGIGLSILHNLIWSLTKGNKWRLTSRWLWPDTPIQISIPELVPASLTPIGKTGFVKTSPVYLVFNEPTVFYRVSVCLNNTPTGHAGSYRAGLKLQLPGKLLKDTQLLGLSGLSKIFRDPCIFYLDYFYNPGMRQIHIQEFLQERTATRNTWGGGHGWGDTSHWIPRLRDCRVHAPNRTLPWSLTSQGRAFHREQALPFPCLNAVSHRGVAARVMPPTRTQTTPFFLLASTWPSGSLSMVITGHRDKISTRLSQYSSRGQYSQTICWMNAVSLADFTASNLFSGIIHMTNTI